MLRFFTKKEKINKEESEIAPIIENELPSTMEEPKIEENSPDRIGEFSVNDYPIDERNNQFYFYEYCVPDGLWVEKGEIICKIRIGENADCTFKCAKIVANNSGILEWVLEKDCRLEEKMVYYKLHEKGVYEKENTIESEEYKHHFLQDTKGGFRSREWLVADGSFVNQGDNIYKILDSNWKEYFHTAERQGYIDIVNIKYVTYIKQYELLYYIRRDDTQRVIEKYQNIPTILEDDFTQSKNIIWKRVSRDCNLGYGITSNSDDNKVKMTFTFNYLQNGDKIVFHFDTKQIRLRQNDKISFLFEGGELIEYILSSNPISIKNRYDEKVLEYKTSITKIELETFINKDFKKWKIELVNENREILGGNSGAEREYGAKRNLIIVTKKFASDYLTTVLANIQDYQPIETRMIENSIEESKEECYVYLMIDTTNNYHKIGISNSPYYREKTLQSEKPTIELIISKKYPSRQIASSIEKALHETFKTKNTRGEWFELSETDIIEIKETLK
jgi:hypothetical protein